LAHLPTPELLDERTIRVHFATLDDRKYGRIGHVDVDPRDPTRVLREADEPALDLGLPGTFDDSGVNPACVVTVGGRRMLYYVGWQRVERVPYQMYAGLAEEDGPRFRRTSAAPVLDRTDAEPFLRSATSVLFDGGRYRAWYVSARGWTEVAGKPLPIYVVRLTESADGRRWSDGGPVCIEHQCDDEFGIGRPWVVRDPDRYRMWYSVRTRSGPYRIGYAESDDGARWTRRDADVGITRSEDGWDSEMVCHAAVLDVNGRRLMFYNGNGHGATGFGVAVLEG
jgi:hypothetical protein